MADQEDIKKTKEEIQEEEQISEENQPKEEKKDKKIQELEEQAKRYLADYQNLQRRTQEQKIEWIKSANKDLLLKLLPVLDTLMLAQKHISDKGLEISIEQFLKVLEGEGVTKIETKDLVFDPHTMECVTTAEGEKGKVIEEIRAGYMLNESVLRSAQVIVGA